MPVTHTTAAQEARDAARLAARVSYGRLLSLLASRTGQLEAAEDALADAFERALITWPEDGVPTNPDAWLLTVGRNRLRDMWRSAAAARTSSLDPVLEIPAELDDPDPDAVGDHRLELLLVCAHPAIAPTARTPLMLNTVLGFTAAQIGEAFHVPTSTMATRLVRAKKRIQVNRIPFRIPDRSQLAGRLNDVLEAVYGAYAIEWSTTGPQTRRLPPEALFLAELLAELLPQDPEVRGLAALVLLSTARRAAGMDNETEPLAEQPVIAPWNNRMVARAHEHLRAAHACGSVGRFQLEAAIQAVHAARRPGETLDYATLLDLYRTLNDVAPSLGSATALAAVVAAVDGPAEGLLILDALGEDARRFQPAWATRAHLLAQIGETASAATAYDKAISLTHDAGQRNELQRRRDALHP